MKLLVVIAFHKSDRDLAVDLLSWIEELGGAKYNPCLIVADSQVTKQDIELVTKTARASFKSVEVISTPFKLPNETWPMGANWMFETAARHISAQHPSQPWIWLEPDSVPTKSSWMSDVEADYEKGNRPFMGRIIRPKQTGLPEYVMSGIGVYPGKLPTKLFQRLISRRNVAWDVSCAELIVPNAQQSRLFWIFHNQSQQPTYVKKKGSDHPANAIEISTIPKHAVIVHTCKDGSLIRVLRELRDTTIPQLIQAWRDDSKVRALQSSPVKKYKQNRFVHCVERHVQRDSDSERRMMAAFHSWVALYKTGRMIPCHVWDYARDSSEMGDNRRLPFIKDLFVEAMTKAGPDDVIVWTNDDTVMHPLLMDALDHKLNSVPACDSFRLNFPKNGFPPLGSSIDELNRIGQPDLGRDLFAFKKQWLKENWIRIPDFLCGEEEFDLTLAVVVRQSAGIITDKSNLKEQVPICELDRGYLLHESHDRFWMSKVNDLSPAKLWNRRLASEWYKSNGFDSLV